jgi:ubiquinone/menaquinone biosynthesis C-methylase UbiE
MTVEPEDKAWLEHREKYPGMYDDANYSSPLQRFVMNASHKLTERAFGPADNFGKVLEIGAGTGVHLGFVRHRFQEYILSDMDHRMLAIAKAQIDAANGERVRFELQQGERLDFPDQSVDRLVATHVLEHIYRPHLAIKEWRRVIRHGGVLSILIPTDPGLAWRIGRRLGPRRHAEAQGIAYDYVMAREHVNSCYNLVAILRHYFPDAKESWWPFPIASVDMNLFFAFHARIDHGNQHQAGA